MYKKLRQLRKINEITLEQVSAETGISVGYLNRIERGYIANIKNQTKRENLEIYIKKLEEMTKEKLQFI